MTLLLGMAPATQPSSDSDIDTVVGGDPVAGIAAVREALKGDPQNLRLLQAMGYLHLKLKRFKEAAGYLDRACANT